MHATLDRGPGEESDALFFADVPDSQKTTPAAAFERCAYGAQRAPNWSMIIAIVALHVITLYALVKLDVIQIAEKKKPLVVDLIAEPPVPPADKPKPQPVVVEKIPPAVLVPPPIVQTTVAPPPIAVTTTPPPPRPVEAAPAPPPTGPVAVGNLNERLLEGSPPRYPMESRRKHEQGTVVVRLLIGTDGRVTDIAIAQSSGFTRLDQAALQAIRGWRWRPIIRDGQPVEVRGLYSMPFTLNG
jgi:protein TonB